jgi:hypothetical protein
MPIMHNENNSEVVIFVFILSSFSSKLNMYKITQKDNTKTMLESINYKYIFAICEK